VQELFAEAIQSNRQNKKLSFSILYRPQRTSIKPAKASIFHYIEAHLQRRALEALLRGRLGKRLYGFKK
jgi:hypothetical protein